MRMMGKGKSRVFMSIAAAVLVMGGVAAAQPGATSAAVSDIAGHWGEAAIAGAVKKGYVDGYEDGTFRPDREVTRAEFVTMLSKALGLKPFPKEPGDDWYDPYMMAVANAGIHRWSDFTTGDWNTPISREEMARMSLRATDPELQKPDNATDVKEMVYLAAKKGLLQGLAGGELGLDQTTTRAQSVTIIERILTVNAGGTLPVDKYAVNRAGVYAIKTNMFDVWPEVFGKLHPGSPKWDPDNLFVETGDGKYRGELDAIVLIDLDDPNDPHWDLLPDVSRLTWINKFARKFYPVKGMRNCYLIVTPGRQVYNYDTSKYGEIPYFPVNIHGFTLDREAMKQGELRGIVQLYLDQRIDIPVYIVPKNIETSGDLVIDIYAPAIPPNNDYRKRLLWVTPPKQVE
ncbi:S-layer homology domain-containing protein [Paenibacillus thermoaerophilus]|uniref:S-layer homology domain-containing protein n=1 Tax=Paenibacillus thermoaerophilus TaxID=1215385 RepID=A0ABW2V5I1_9BACL|nr:S-layer homology domain-containing protein [Paenibacillus thermoaerophilus]TMV17836.1 S-layer homology domain-containing protein [Paenibacillus thermoaerophilus]